MRNFLVLSISILLVLSITGCFISATKKDELLTTVVVVSDVSPDESPPEECHSDYSQQNDSNNSLSSYLSTLYGKILDVPIFYICRIFPLPDNKGKNKNKTKKNNKNKRKR